MIRTRESLASRLDLIALAAVVLIAVIARVLELEQVPPGIQYDAASNGVYVLNILFNGERPFFINHMGAPEPLIVYLQAVTVWLFGASVFALRLVTGLSGALSVFALYACANEFVQDRRVALVAAFALAVSASLIDISRLGLRFALVPLFESALLYFAWRGWRDGALRDFIFAGIVLGLSMYTYIAALMMPVVLVVLWAHLFLTARELWRRRLWQSMTMVTAGVVIAAPRLIFQALYPATALLRASQVSLFQNPAVQSQGIVNVILAHLGSYVEMFGIEWQGGSFNRPLFDPILFGLFLIGVIISLARWKDARWFWALSTIVIMLLPDLLAANESTPNKLRTIGIIPPAFFLVGVGTIDVLDRFNSNTRIRRLVGVALTAALMVSGAWWLDAYFSISPWATPLNRELETFNTNFTEIAEGKWMAQHNEPIYLSLNEYARSPVHLLVGARAPRLRSAIRSDGSLDPAIVTTQAFIIAPVDNMRPRTEGANYVHDPSAYVLIKGDTVYLLPPVSPTIESQVALQKPTQVIRDQQGALVANVYTVDSSNNPLKFIPIKKYSQVVKFSEGIELVDMSLETDRVQPGGVIPISLFWRASKPVADYVIFVHLIDRDERVVSAADVLPGAGAYPTIFWKPDEIVATHHQVRVPARIAPGRYAIEIGMYNSLDQNRLDVLDANSISVDSRVIVGSVKVASRETITYNPLNLQRANFDGKMFLLGYDLGPGKGPREFQMTMYWQGQAKMDHDYIFFAHVLDANGKLVAQSDHQPQLGNYPTSIWDVGEQVRDEFSLAIPDNALAGNCRIEVGWYDLATGARLSKLDANNARTGDSVILDQRLEVNR